MISNRDFKAKRKFIFFMCALIAPCTRFTNLKTKISK